jgi:hypothetical protein
MLTSLDPIRPLAPMTTIFMLSSFYLEFVYIHLTQYPDSLTLLKINKSQSITSKTPGVAQGVVPSKSPAAESKGAALMQ